MKPCVMPKALYKQIWFDVYMIEYHKNKKNMWYILWVQLGTHHLFVFLIQA